MSESFSINLAFTGNWLDVTLILITIWIATTVASLLGGFVAEIVNQLMLRRRESRKAQQGE